MHTLKFIAKVNKIYDETLFENEDGVKLIEENKEYNIKSLWLYEDGTISHLFTGLTSITSEDVDYDLKQLVNGKYVVVYVNIVNE